LRLSTHTRSRLVGWTDQITGLALKLSIPAAVILAAFLLVTIYGRHLREVAKLSASERAYLFDSVQFATQALVIAAAVLVASLMIRFFREEAVGQSLSLAGAAVYFGSPLLFGATVQGMPAQSAPLLASIVAAFRTVGGIGLIPGLFLVLRDSILRIWTGISVRRVMERRWGDEEERRKRFRPKLYGACWDMPFCREFVRKVCPAFAARKSCWRVKCGCYCDEKTILRAMTTSGADNEHVRGIMRSLGLSEQRESRISNKLKRERCRRCGIYAEHQRQKYRLLSPMVFPLIGALMYVFYGQISALIRVALQKTDRFMAFLSYRSDAYSLGDQGQVLTTLAIAWIAIIAVSYALRALEYLVFELQV